MTPAQELEAFKTWPDEDIGRLLASRVRRLRLEAGQSQEALALLANVPLRTFKRFETDGKANLETFIRVLRALNRVQYLHLLLPGNRLKVASAVEEKLAQARTRWQKPSDL